MASFFTFRGGLLWKLSTICCGERCQKCCDCCFRRRSSSLEDLQNHFATSEEDLSSGIMVPDTPTSTTTHSTRLPSSSSRRSSHASCSDSRRGSTPVSEYTRRSSTPVPIIDMKPIEFWPPSTNQETVQPRQLQRRYTNDFGVFSEEDLKIEPKLYEVTENEEDLTDEEKVARYKLGKIHFGIKYDISNEQLNIRIIQARELPSPVFYDTSKQDLVHSNPYVKICLLPDQKESRQTSVKRKTQDPDFEENFAFDIPYQEAQRRWLHLTVLDFDKFSRHCVIGQHTLPLDGVNLLKGNHYWKPLQPPNQNNPGHGEILISLNYLPSAGRLNIDVIKAKQLLQRDIGRGSDPFVKLQLVTGQKVVKSKKSSTKRNTLDPVFNETFSFNVSPAVLADICLLVTVYDYSCKSRDDFTGQIIMGKHSSGQGETTHWQRMMVSKRSPVAQWHTLRTREECEGVLPFNMSFIS